MKETIFPAYVVVDFSESMGRPVDTSTSKTRIDVATEIIPALLESMENDSNIAESLRVRVIGFNDSIVFCTELFDYDELKSWYKEKKDSFKKMCEYQTWYGAAFKKLNECIDKDMDQIVRNGESFFRPLVYFLTDGKPYGENPNSRETNYRALVTNKDSHRRPVILCVGIGPEDMSILKQYGASRLDTKNNEYRYGNEKMTFVIRSGVKTGSGLSILNDKVVSTIKYSLQRRSGTSINEIDTSVINDKEAGADLLAFFNRGDNLK